jgi:methionyl-tRNA synthetase
MGDFKFHLGLQAVWEFVSKANRYIVQNEPWALAREEASRARLQTVLYNLGESLRLLALVLKPVMPRTAEKMMQGLGIDSHSEMMQTLAQGGIWGLSKPGSAMAAVGNLFPRIEVKKKESGKKAAVSQKGGKKSEQGNQIGFDHFKGVDLRVARVVAAEPVPKSNKLLKLRVEAPEERTIVSGIAGSCRPEDLIGKEVVIVANLKPVTLMGIVSEGMVLTAESEDRDGSKRLSLVTVPSGVKPGTPIA